MARLSTWIASPSTQTVTTLVIGALRPHVIVLSNVLLLPLRTHEPAQPGST